MPDDKALRKNEAHQKSWIAEIRPKAGRGASKDPVGRFDEDPTRAGPEDPLEGRGTQEISGIQGREFTVLSRSFDQLHAN